jgi:outer membrane scaffolding protein for murein synthesis (MipA/OmpV family)
MPARTRRPDARRALLSAAACGLCALSAAHADERPVWELGLGVGLIAFNDYRGADTSHAYPVPVPYFIYRGHFLKSDENGTRAQFFTDPRVEFNLSVAATTPVRNSSERAGMPDLKSTLELGGSLEVHLWRSDDRRFKLDFRVPARAAVTVESSPHMIGVYVTPQMNLDIEQYPRAEGWKLGLVAGPIFETQRYSAYFYTVAPQYATPSRPAYEAPGGYAGTQFLVSLTRRFPHYWIGAYLRYDTLAGASFADSPLVTKNSYWTGGFGFAWIISQSSRLIESDD